MVSSNLAEGDYLQATYKNKTHYGQVQTFAGFLVFKIERTPIPFLEGKMVRMHTLDRWIRLTEKQYFMELLRRG